MNSPSQADAERMLRLLHDAWEALKAVQRCGYPLSDDWPIQATDSYDAIGDFLWPDDGIRPEDRWGLIRGEPLDASARPAPAALGESSDREEALMQCPDSPGVHTPASRSATQSSRGVS